MHNDIALHHSLTKTNVHGACRAQLLTVLINFFLSDAVFNKEQKDVMEVATAKDCWKLVWSVALLQELPSPAMFDRLDVTNGLQEIVDAWFSASWFC